MYHTAIACMYFICKLHFLYNFRGKEFPKMCKRLRIGPEDQAVGTVVQIINGHNFTRETGFHFQKIMDIPSSTYKQQVCKSYV